ncbi:hypothetical protein [Streptomyces sp. x-80]|uniref:hypothetical protein n=1 Tax=Streptomyces sp. x-80 TaxID=2789282 RepID=UPI00397F3F2B
MPDRAPQDPPPGPAPVPHHTPDSAPAARPADPDHAPARQHHVSTTERGSFCLARCDCGWSGPARRARSQARTDATRHLTDHHTPAEHPPE